MESYQQSLEKGMSLSEPQFLCLFSFVHKFLEWNFLYNSRENSKPPLFLIPSRRPWLLWNLSFFLHVKMAFWMWRKKCFGWSRKSNSGDTKPERSLKNEQELTVEEEARMREEVKARMSGIRSNAEKAKQMGSTRSTMHYSSVGVDLGDVRTGLSVSRGGFAPRPLSVSFSAKPTLCETAKVQQPLYSIYHFL